MIELFKTANVSARNASDAQHLTLFVNDAGLLCLKANNGVVSVVTGSGGGGSGTNGTNGRGIVSISRTSGTGLAGSTDTYTITYTDASTSSFNVVNGANGTNGTNGTNGLPGTNGQNGANGRGITGIARTSGNGAAGTTDIYTISYSDGTTSTFNVTNGANGSGGSGSASVPVYGADVTAGRTILTADLQNLIIFNSSINENFTIPNDTALGISGNTNASFEIYQKGNGVANFIPGSGVNPIVKWNGYPTPTLGTTQTIHRVGANTWAVK